MVLQHLWMYTSDLYMRILPCSKWNTYAPPSLIHFLLRKGSLVLINIYLVRAMLLNSKPRFARLYRDGPRFAHEFSPPCKPVCFVRSPLIKLWLRLRIPRMSLLRYIMPAEVFNAHSDLAIYRFSPGVGSLALLISNRWLVNPVRWFSVRRWVSLVHTNNPTWRTVWTTGKSLEHSSRNQLR